MEESLKISEELRNFEGNVFNFSFYLLQLFSFRQALWIWKKKMFS